MANPGKNNKRVYSPASKVALVLFVLLLGAALSVKVEYQISLINGERRKIWSILSIPVSAEYQQTKLSKLFAHYGDNVDEDENTWAVLHYNSGYSFFLTGFVFLNHGDWVARRRMGISQGAFIAFPSLCIIAEHDFDRFRVLAGKLLADGENTELSLEIMDLSSEYTHDSASAE